DLDEARDHPLDDGEAIGVGGLTGTAALPIAYVEPDARQRRAALGGDDPGAHGPEERQAVRGPDRHVDLGLPGRHERLADDVLPQHDRDPYRPRRVDLELADEPLRQAVVTPALLP